MSAHVKTLADLALELQTPLSLDDMLQRLVEGTAAILGTDRTSIRLLDATRTRLLAVCRHGEPVHAGRHEEFRMGEGLIGWIAEHGEPICTGDAENDLRFVERPGMRTRLASFLGVPLLSENRSLGVLSAVSASPDFFREEQLSQLTLIAAIAAPRVDAVRVKRLAKVDALTGALNRRGMDSELPPVLLDPNEVAEPLSVVVADLDRFAEINDRLGREVGDEVLRAVGELFASMLGETDAIVRYGGEEFLLILPEVALEPAQRMAERARQTLSEAPIEAGGETIRMTASFGVAQRRPDETRDELLARAVAAMHRAKAAGRDRVAIVLSSERRS